MYILCANSPCCQKSPVPRLKSGNGSLRKGLSRLACTFCTCVRGNNSPYRKVMSVRICRSKRETGRLGIVDIKNVVVIKQCFLSVNTPANKVTSNQEYFWQNVANGTCRRHKLHLICEVMNTTAIGTGGFPLLFLFVSQQWAPLPILRAQSAKMPLTRAS